MLNAKRDGQPARRSARLAQTWLGLQRCSPLGPEVRSCVLEGPRHLLVRITEEGHVPGDDDGEARLVRRSMRAGLCLQEDLNG